MSRLLAAALLISACASDPCSPRVTSMACFAYGKPEPPAPPDSFFDYFEAELALDLWNVPGGLPTILALPAAIPKAIIEAQRQRNWERLMNAADEADKYGRHEEAQALRRQAERMRKERP